MTLGDKIQRLMDRDSLKQTHLARKLGISTGNLATIIKRSTCSLRTAAKISRLFRVSLDWLTDPDQGFPPQACVIEAGDGALAFELHQRRVAFLKEFAEYYNRWQKVKWQEVYSWCETHPVGAEAPDAVQEGLVLLRMRFRYYQRYDALWLISIGTSTDDQEVRFVHWIGSDKKDRLAWSDRLMMHLYPHLERPPDKVAGHRRSHARKPID